MIRENDKNKTLGEIAREKGFANLSDYVADAFKKKDNLETLKVGDVVKLPTGYKPTHFETEKVLPLDTDLKVSEVDKPDIFLNYHIKVEGFDLWFDAKLFLIKTNGK